MPSSVPLSATQTERERPFASSAAILRSLPDGIIITDLAGCIRQINLAAAQWLSVDPEAVLEQDLGVLPCAAALRQHDETLPGMIEIGDRIISFEKRPLLAEDDRQPALGTLFILRDRSADLAERRQRYDFFCRALHDVRVPLQAISGAAEGLMRGWFGPLTDDQREFAGIIKENASHQGDLLGQLYDAYALSMHFIKLNLEHFTIESMLHEIEQEFAPRFIERDQAFTISLPIDQARISADRQRLRQIVIVLLSNALRYTQPGGAVALRAQQSATHVLIEVQDTGVGIRAEDQPKLFTPFFRGENPLKDGRYGGLNLMIAKLLVEMHGGQIWFTSVEGHGSTFSFEIPVR